MKATVVSMAVVGLLVTVAGHADDTQPAPPSPASARLQRLMTRFHQADVNGDGKLTRDEAQQGMPRVYQHFSEIDTDNKGFVTLQEIAAFAQSHPEAGRGRRQPPPAQ